MSSEVEKQEFVFTERFYKDYESYFHKRPTLDKITHTDLEEGLEPDNSDDVIDPPLRDGAVPYVHEYFPGFVFVVTPSDYSDEYVVVTMRPRTMRLKKPEQIDAPNKKERRQIERHQTHLETMNNLIAEIKSLRKEMAEMRQNQLQTVGY